VPNRIDHSNERDNDKKLHPTASETFPSNAFQKLSASFLHDCAAHPLASPPRPNSPVRSAATTTTATTTKQSPTHLRTNPKDFQNVENIDADADVVLEEETNLDSLTLFKRQVARDLAYWYAKGSITAVDLAGPSTVARPVTFRQGRFTSNLSPYGTDHSYKIPLPFQKIGLPELLFFLFLFFFFSFDEDLC
jgi:hypothetical protein